jgi:hypothetical protein
MHLRSLSVVLVLELSQETLKTNKNKDSELTVPSKMTQRPFIRTVKSSPFSRFKTSFTDLVGLASMGETGTPGCSVHSK